MKHKTKRKKAAVKPAPKPSRGSALSATSNKDVVTIPGKSNGNAEAELAEAYLRPTVGAGSTVRTYCRSADGGGPDVNALIAELDKQTQAVNGGDLRRAEAMLLSQAHALDSIFSTLAKRAAKNFGEYLGAGETYLRLALKAQSQCRATLETLAAIKNPPNVAFVRQANIAAGPQQVNNSLLAGEPSRARETEILQSKLLEAQDGERLDTEAAGAAGSANPQLATVGTIDRPENQEG